VCFTCFKNVCFTRFCKTPLLHFLSKPQPITTIIPRRAHDFFLKKIPLGDQNVRASKPCVSHDTITCVSHDTKTCVSVVLKTCGPYDMKPCVSPGLKTCVSHGFAKHHCYTSCRNLNRLPLLYRGVPTTFFKEDTTGRSKRTSE
jgi:hypothetical protein